MKLPKPISTNLIIKMGSDFLVDIIYPKLWQKECLENNDSKLHFFTLLVLHNKVVKGIWKNHIIS